MEGISFNLYVSKFSFPSLTKKSMWPRKAILTHKTNQQCQPTNDGVWNNQESMDFKSNGVHKLNMNQLQTRWKTNDRKYINKVMKKTCNKIMILWSFLSSGWRKTKMI
jgi:hypothetical protein